MAALRSFSRFIIERYFFLMPATAENPVSYRQDVAKRRRMFKAFLLS
jgi:hypothetical protein